MSEENIKVITDKEELYEYCENVEQLFDKFYLPLLDIHYRKTYNLQQKVEQLENIRKEAIEYILKNKLYRFEYDDEELFEITTDKKAKDDLLNILNKGSEFNVKENNTNNN